MLASEITAEEFADLFIRFRDPYISIARSYTRDYEAAADIVTDCFEAFWNNRSRLELKSLPEAYILQSVKNRSLNYLRRSDVRMKVGDIQDTDMLKIVELDMAFLGEDHTSFLFEAEVHSIINNCLASFPNETREIFIASRWGGHTYQEIAEIYNVSERKVKRDISKVLAALRIALADYLPVWFLIFHSFKNWF
ncbi:MAG: sigma-70 family RNA polymerase sigma factor [Candidatus Cryptobacteroides sp.]